ncbi:ATP-binding protein [Actinoplanes campanulatus]|uniref:ATP-binding protein n=1 Tax=Actinoplanes campanulatus TaxID=113559 RepID=UPI001EF31307
MPITVAAVGGSAGPPTVPIGCHPLAGLVSPRPDPRQPDQQRRQVRRRRRHDRRHRPGPACHRNSATASSTVSPAPNHRRQGPGTGLGLYIVRELARANGGDVRHRPSPRGGSVFVISLPSP